jgi:hypothetical protein
MGGNRFLVYSRFCNRHPSLIEMNGGGEVKAALSSESQVKPDGAGGNNA